MEATSSYPEQVFAAVLLPLPFPEPFTYRIPLHLLPSVKPGHRVVVQFGARKVLTGVVTALGSKAPNGVQAKYILDVLDDSPLVTGQQLAFFQFIARYYLCTAGEVLQAALPAGLKLSSTSMLQSVQDIPQDTTYTAREQALLDALSIGSLSYDDACKTLNIKQIAPIVRSLLSKGAITLLEQVEERYKPEVEKRIYLESWYRSEGQVEALVEALTSKPKQQEVVLSMIQWLRGKYDQGILKSQLVAAGHTTASISALKKAGVLEEKQHVVSRIRMSDAPLHPLPVLSDAQQKAYLACKQGLMEGKPVLLHGITGSGKTEVYMHLIAEALSSGAQVLFLLPEIALSEQIMHRMQARFGDRMAVFHSRFSDNERVEVYRGLLADQFDLIVGVRSAIFLPFTRLGLVLIDEEHDTSFKQQDPAPRYNGRDASLMLAQLAKASVVLGSATPSAESWHLALSGKYYPVHLLQRFNTLPPPEVTISNLRAEQRAKTVQFEFGKALLDALVETVQKKEQSIVFHNRRGYAHWLSCNSCNHTPMCVQCAVSLTYHQAAGVLRCHYCGYSRQVPQTCPACGAHDFRTVGFGTEQVDEHLAVLLPDARIRRMDQDTTRGKYSFRELMDSLQSRKIDILVGTQMVTKGLDLGHVTLVGILNSDRMLYYPDFRAQERTFQTLMQVCGRAGRAEKPGRVIVQTHDPEHPLYKALLQGDYASFIEDQLLERKQFGYPPFTRLIRIEAGHQDRPTVLQFARALGIRIRELQGIKVLGPEEPTIARLKNLWRQELLIKVPRQAKDVSGIKNALAQIVQRLLQEKGYRSMRLTLDVDPL
jgi:primosomal protein N' (replication factor Y)